MTKVQWSRENPEAPTKWILEDGTEALFQPGQVWFFLTDQEPEFEYPVVKPAK
jgi:hypothetical protein